jgi:FKBP-type peptidyl-prolyl cis-trans isomerase
LKRFVLALICLATIVSALACGGGDEGPTTPSAPLVVDDLIVGTGATVATGDVVTVHYVGTLANGVKFDSSYDRGQPFTFRVGAGQVIQGWDQGLPGMKVGGKRRLRIPPELGYGSAGSGPIPGGATILFEIDLLSIAGK